MSDVMATGNNSSIETYCAQVKTIWIDSDKLMTSVKLFYKPDQLRNELKEAEREKLAANELVCIDAEPVQHFEVDTIKSKCSILFDMDKFEKYVRSLTFGFL